MFKPESYTKIGEHDYIFHYSFSDLRAFVKEGSQTELAVWILHSYINNTIKRIGYVRQYNGIIKRFSLIYELDPAWDGDPFDPDRQLKSYIPIHEPHPESYRYEILDIGNVNSITFNYKKTE